MLEQCAGKGIELSSLITRKPATTLAKTKSLLTRSPRTAPPASPDWRRR